MRVTYAEFVRDRAHYAKLAKEETVEVIGEDGRQIMALSTLRCEDDEEDRLRAEIERLRRERDEARAEVDRLRAARGSDLRGLLGEACAKWSNDDLRGAAGEPGARRVAPARGCPMPLSASPGRPDHDPGDPGCPREKATGPREQDPRPAQTATRSQESPGALSVRPASELVLARPGFFSSGDGDDPHRATGQRLDAGPVHIYCHGGNERAAQIAREHGWLLGSRSDYAIYPCARPLALLDIEWKSPDWPRHIAVARRERPWLCAVPDLERAEQLPAALAQAEEVAPYCTRLLLIPKALGVIDRIPVEIGGRPVVLGYSVPTSYGGTSVPLWEFGPRPVHLLGGSPRAQRMLTRYLHVVSIDGNAAWNLARRGIFYGPDGTSPQTNTLKRADGARFASSGPYEALRRSLVNLRRFWGFTEVA